MDSSGLGIYRGAVMDLDISKRYKYIDKKEVKWIFTYQSIASDEGWFVWRTAPGQTEICVGKTSEEEIIKALNENPPLTPDDLIDLELWMLKGEGSKYIPRS